MIYVYDCGCGAHGWHDRQPHGGWSCPHCGRCDVLNWAQFIDPPTEFDNTVLRWLLTALLIGVVLGFIISHFGPL